MVDVDEEEHFKNGLKLQRKYAKFSLSIASFTSKLINDSLKSGFCNARQQKRQNISIILQNSRLFTKTTFYRFIIWLYTPILLQIKSCQALSEQLLFQCCASFSSSLLIWLLWQPALLKRVKWLPLRKSPLPAFLCLRLISALMLLSNSLICLRLLLSKR